MKAKPNIIFRTVLLLILASSVAFGQAAERERKSFEATKYILVKAKEFVRTNDKKLMVIIIPREITFLPTR